MAPDRVALTVMINLDPVPGAFHTPESARDQVQAIMLSMVPHYEPIVVLND